MKIKKIGAPSINIAKKEIKLITLDDEVIQMIRPTNIEGGLGP